MLKTETIKRPRGIEDLLTPELLAKISPLDVSSRKIFSGKLKGERRSKKRGESVEFADHRSYVSGDDTRHIDWNLFARLDVLFLKLYLEEEDLSLHVVFDASASADCGKPSKFDFMQKAAMALGYVGLVNLNRVACTVMGGTTASALDKKDDESETGKPTIQPTRALRDLRGRRRAVELAQFICDTEPAGGFNFRQAAERIALSRRGKGVMLVMSDFLFKEGYEDGLRMLLGRGYDLIVVQVLSPDEIDPSITGDLALKDVEDSDLAEVTISSPLLKKYKQTVTAYTERLREFCGRRGMQYMLVRSDTSIETLMLDYLRKRGVLK
ncbi:MAG: DUF58 domain-containing protein [Planctomycetota bacterium]